MTEATTTLTRAALLEQCPERVIAYFQDRRVRYAA